MYNIPEDSTHQTTWTDVDSPSTAVVVGVVEAMNTDPNDLDVLNDYVDSDALDALLTGSPLGVDVTFDCDDVTVSVSAGGSVLMEANE
ncbi:MAG: HalOD1 output domain-containing protein [Natronomonas sp.]|uniref:HalOD1 output domain-containing protein n=1 Tax=Natronomonas sp. TaxID=2184060 RepID=UPI00287020DB|nr:HalOD1 output domain-containing protein [Natronomonas sp.]MDR9431904.1 HalOD1 output domain-containing protein [Natronomonas sp.]